MSKLDALSMEKIKANVVSIVTYIDAQYKTNITQKMRENMADGEFYVFHVKITYSFV